MMQQYDAAKAACGDALLLFRMGDFYELFHEDAKIAARNLGLTLTSRDKGENAIPMAGFPHHQLDSYLAKLIKQGHRVAVCEQVEDASAAKGIVKREITRTVSPGTVTDHELLDPRESNFLFAACPSHADGKQGSKRTTNSRQTTQWGIAWIDLSTGVFFASSIEPSQLADFLTRLNPSEILLPDDWTEDLSTAANTIITRRPAWTFATKHALESLTRHFRVANLEGFGFHSTDSAAIRAAGAVVEYIRENQSSALDYVDRLQPFARGDTMEIDQATWHSLEIMRTIRSNRRDGSLIETIDHTVSSMGSRMLASWLRQPLTRRSEIQARQDGVQELIEQATLRTDIRKFLKNVYDIQRLLARLTSGRATPRDLSSIANTLAALPSLKAKLTGRSSQILAQLEADLDLCVQLRTSLQSALVTECPLAATDGGFIREGYDPSLDEYRMLAAGGKQWIAEYQARISAETQIPSLKVGYNKVFGYYLEVTHVHRDKVPPEFVRKQTLKNAERFITPELKEYEDKVLSADQQAKDLEYAIFCRLRDEVRSHVPRLKLNGQVIAVLDVLAGLAELAVQHGYCRPKIVEDSILKICDGRHPVLDITQPLGSFVPNQTNLGEDSGMIHLITGPNMAGKSTYIRQVALITLLSHVGSFVPASSATIGVTDRLFARVGASDELSRGQSTFMVEMTETARILNNATSRSVVILDEIGRGTSTYDGVSLAWAIVEFIHERIGCRTLFATHYHELTKLDESLNGVRNFNVEVKEWQDQIVFLHKIAPGAADKSYGIHVAQLAGVPSWVNRRAEKILSQLESENPANPQIVPSTSRTASEIQLTLFGNTNHPLLDKIKGIDTNQVTPMNALEMIQKWQSELASEEDAPSQVKS